MSISASLKTYLDKRLINYDLIAHKHTDTTYNAARAAHVPVERMVKGVLLGDDRGYLMAAVPATRKLDLTEINRKTGRSLKVVPESQLQQVLVGCNRGAVPAIGEAYGIETVWDETLAFEPDFYIEAGDHEELVHLSHYDFMELMSDENRAPLTH